MAALISVLSRRLFVVPRGVDVLALLQISAPAAPDDVGDVDEAVRRPLGVVVRPHDETLIGEPARLEVIEPGSERLHADDVDLGVRLRCERVAGVASDRAVALHAVADEVEFPLRSLFDGTS